MTNMNSTPAQQRDQPADIDHQDIAESELKSNNKICKENVDNKKDISDIHLDYWKMKYIALKNDYDHLQKLNQGLEEKLLNVVETFERKKEELVANAEYEKSTLMADVDKLSTKLVDARMKLHDREEKDVLHAAECTSPCHGRIVLSKSDNDVKKIDQTQHQQMMNDPNII